MNIIKKQPLHSIGYNFVPEDFLPEGEDEYFLRKRQWGQKINYRQLSAQEIEVLVKNDNSADNWNDILVSDHFDPSLVKNNQFHGLIRIGDLEALYLEFHDIPLAVGIYNSNIISCDIGSNVSINNVNLLSHYLIEDEVILHNINEMLTTNYAKFGNGIIKEGEDESLRIWVEVSNENGGRAIIPFDGMNAADAWLWSQYRERHSLMKALKGMTQKKFDEKRGYYGRIGTRTVIKHCKILKDVNIGTDAYIKGSNKLKNLTINSSAESPSQIGEGVEMVNGIIGYGCHAFYGIKAVRFIMDDYTNLKYGARLINSFLGNNSTISCCEVLNALIYPGHEQHHNSSFLCASTILGQSNMASGATIGSNHNSRGNDGEILAGRGFWPGLSTSLKHNCRFASFNLLVKGAYPYEIDNPLPFSLIANHENTDSLSIIPAYWFRYNMYALARNSWKYGARDKRKNKKLNIIFDYLAPDTVNEMFCALKLLRETISNSPEFRSQQTYTDVHEFIMNENIQYSTTDKIENGNRLVQIYKPCHAYRDYLDMILFYAVKVFINDGCNFQDILDASEQSGHREQWSNIGGQLIPAPSLESFLKEIESGKIQSWEAVHEFYSQSAADYPQDLLNHGIVSIIDYCNIHSLEFNDSEFRGILNKAITISRNITEKCYESRAKDYTNPFRAMTFNSEDERDAVLGKLDENNFIKSTRQEAEALENKIMSFIKK